LWVFVYFGFVKVVVVVTPTSVFTLGALCPYDMTSQCVSSLAMGTCCACVEWHGVVAGSGMASGGASCEGLSYSGVSSLSGKVVLFSAVCLASSFKDGGEVVVIEEVPVLMVIQLGVMLTPLSKVMS
jgi:hypothetical protein